MGTWVEVAALVAAATAVRRRAAVPRRTIPRCHEQQFQQKQQSGGCSGGVNGCIFRPPCVWIDECSSERQRYSGSKLQLWTCVRAAACVWVPATALASCGC